MQMHTQSLMISAGWELEHLLLACPFCVITCVHIVAGVFLRMFTACDLEGRRETPAVAVQQKNMTAMLVEVVAASK
jgi:hypothetical protein